MIKDITSQVKETNDWVYKRLEIILQIEDDLLRRLLLVTVIDSFAQHNSEYQRNNVQAHFADFLCKYGAQRWPFLKQICCITLYNQFVEQFVVAKIELNIAQSSLPTADNPVLEKEAKKLVWFLSEQGISNQKIQRHTFANLIYAMRNKISHELTNPGCPINFYNHNEKQIPFVAQEYEIFFNEDENKNGIRPKCWNLHMPEQFLIDLLLEVTSNYLNECLMSNVAPFRNNSYDRKFYTAWYDD